MIQAYRERNKSLTRIDRIVRDKEFAARALLIDRQAQEIFNELPLHVKRSTTKGTVKRHVSQYLKQHGIAEDQNLRLAIYKLWREQYEQS